MEHSDIQQEAPVKKSWLDKLYFWLLWVGAPTKAMFFISLLINLVLLIFCLIILFPHDAFFSSEVTTEQFEFAVPELGPLPAWGRQPVVAFSAPDGSICNTPILELDGDSDVLFNRSSSAIDFVVSTSNSTGIFAKLSSRTEEHLPASVVCESGKHYLAPKEIVIRFLPEAFQGRSYPLRGAITLGGTSVGEPSHIRLLLGGTVTVTARSFPIGSGRVSDSQTLVLGDTIRFFTSSENEMPNAALLVRYDNEKAAFKVVAHVIAREAAVYRFGNSRSEIISISPSSWDRVRAQPVWATLGVMLALLLSMLNTTRQQHSTEKESDR